MGDSPQQRASWREAVGYDNDIARTNLEGQFRDWKSKLTALQSQITDNERQQRKSNRRYQQVSAAGGSGDYGLPETGQNIQKLRKQVETADSGIDYKPDFSGTYGLRTAADIDKERQGINDQINAYNAQIADLQAKKSAPYTGGPKPDIAGIDSQINQIQGKIPALKNSLAPLDSLYAEQEPFEREQIAKANQFNSSINEREKQFIDSILNQELPPDPSLRGVKVQPTEQQLEAQRAEVINSTIKQAPQQTTNAKFDTYLAKNPGGLPLAGFNLANLKSAKNKVQGATLGGNTNQLVGG